ncbi:nicotinate-nucleotide adenylyltransferase [Periweissella cryptocerci]|uniref:Probable nicotinate-nucleotide adenylyltransferase n=1 Tax=Periweissella cryptocerci TaxID=2506420 RepID=A0A4P6YVI6_9LACO|nr:nicotinate-nucleotide adenylyltransferase [Periweissella cryptocerci]QBO36766.1 nicotinate-nucleotide adenylyltransferase [Periweissella cryptocerci]
MKWGEPVLTTVLDKKSATQVLTEMTINQPKKRVGIMGGTFNPIHNGHLIMADQVGTQLGLDKVLFMPNATPPHVDLKKAIDGRTRARLIRRAITGNPLFDLETLELQRGGKSYSYNTLLALTQLHPDVEYYFIIGADEVEYLPTWYRIDDLLQLTTFVAVKRKGHEQLSRYPVIWVDSPMIEISSTDIRRRIKYGQSIRYLVPEAVEDYIKEHKLYQDDKKD